MNHILAAACASITGISLGVALHHKQSLGTIPPTAQQSLPVEFQLAPEYSPAERSVSPQYAPAQPSNGITDAAGNSQLERKLNTLLELQETMRSQQSELNRELNAIQFRLDTHSASFRPLQSERATEVLSPSVSTRPLTPLLPPRQ